MKKTKKAKTASRAKKSSLVFAAFIFPAFLVGYSYSSFGTFSVFSLFSSQSSGTISASPNPCTFTAGKTVCNSTISWNTQGVSQARVYYGEALFANAILGSQSAPWIGENPNDTPFYLYDYSSGSRGALLDSVVVKGTDIAATNPADLGSITASPNPCTFTAGKTVCTSTISWMTKDVSQARVYYGEALFANAPSGSQSAPWISTNAGNIPFYLYDYSSGSRGALLDSVVVKGSDTTTEDPGDTTTSPGFGSIIASPNPCIFSAFKTTCDSVISWATRNVDNARIYVGETLFAQALSGSQNASWINANGATFDLYEYKGDTRVKLLGSITVSGKKSSASSVAKDYTASFSYGGYSRTYDVHIPDKYNNGNTPLPLVLLLHGGGDVNASQTKIATQMSQKADQEGFVVVYPHAINDGWWNSGYIPAGLLNDDVGYLNALISRLKSQLKLTGDVFIAGGSNGGMMAYWATAKIDNISAVAIVSGTVGGYKTSTTPAFTIPAPRKPVPAMITHGNADPLVPYNGGKLEMNGKQYDFISAPNSAKLWAGYNGAGQTPVNTYMLDGGKIKVERFKSSPADSEVIFYSLMKSGHNWPGSSLDPINQLNATDYVWNFFKAHKKH